MGLLIIKSQSKGWINLVNRFSKKNSVVWITGNKIDRNSVCITHKEALLCKIKKIKLKKNIKLTKEDFDLINKNFTFLNDLLNRNLVNTDQVNYFSKREFIINSFRFWKNFLINYPIKKVISRRAPHRFYDLIIYLICMHYKIKILFIDNTTEIYPCRNRLIEANYFSNNLIKRTNNFVNKKKKTFLAKEYLKIISKKKLDLRPNYFLKKVEHKEDTLTQFKLILPRLLIKFFLGLKSFFFKKKEFKIQILKKRFKEASHLDILLHNYNKQLELKEYISLYKKYSIELSKIHKYNYIYFSLNRDVEKTVCPDGKVFKDVEFILDYAVTFLPKNYYLFIKDHPACFLIKNATNINRNTYFLKKIINKSNRIKIIDINENQSEIIKKSKGVISLTGTSCWEAILLGKPSAVFGTTWYEKCSLIYNISEKGQFIKFINRLKKKSKLNKKEIIKFLRFIYYNCFSSKFLNLDDKKNKEKNINFLTNEIKKKKF